VDLFTIGVLGTILMGLMAGDAAINANTLTVRVDLPPVVQQSGLTRGPAEEIFTTEIARITSIPSPVPAPTARVASRRTVIGALAEPLKLTEMTAALQDLFGLEPTRISATMLQAEAGLRMEMVVAQEGRPPRYLQISQPNLDAVALIRRAAQDGYAEVAPFRVLLARVHSLLVGSDTNIGAARDAATNVRGRGDQAIDATQYSAITNLAGVLALLEGDAVQAAREVRAAASVPGALSSARGIFELNGAFLSILAGDLEQARLQTERAIDAIPRHPIANFPAYVLIQRGLLAWAEGQREAALQLMRQALHVDPANRNAQIYISWLQHLNSGAPGQFDPASLSGYSNRSAVIPALMASVFLQEPLARQFQRAPLR
jgi:tetratricopeptide (TPR) repeat protein